MEEVRRGIRRRKFERVDIIPATYMQLIGNSEATIFYDHKGTGNRPQFQKGVNMTNEFITGLVIIVAFVLLVVGILLYDSDED